MTDELLSAAVAIGDELCESAICHDGVAVWTGDERSTETDIVHRSLDGDLYGGSSGIALFLAQLAVVTGDARHRETAIAGFRHGVRWCATTRPVFSLYTGVGGVALALQRAATLLGSDELDHEVDGLIADASSRIPESHDLIAGRAGTVIAMLALAGRDESLIERAIDIGDRLIADGDQEIGLAWPDGPGEPALCGLGHGAAGGAYALTSLAGFVEGASRDRFTEAADRACRYERAWFRRDHSNWPDLREFTRHTLESGAQPPFPAYWCHGSVGIGLVRLARHRRGATPIDAAEAIAATTSATRSVADMVDRGGVSDSSICHGVAGVAELLIEASRTFRQPDHSELARECLLAALDASSSGAWPIGVPGGHDNPSLMLGTAGIGAVILRLLDPGQPPIGLLYDEPMSLDQVIVQLASVPEAASAEGAFEEMFSPVPGARLKRLSSRGRLVVTVPAGVDIAALCERLNQRDDVEYAELDAIDTAQEG